MGKPLPLVSIIIPCRNEETFIAKCLDSILATTYPIQRLEIFIIDGLSEDNTGKIITLYQKKHPFIRVIKNSKKIIPVAMNIGIKHAKGDVIIKMDAHTTYLKDYITKCIDYLEQYQADNVGGMLVTRPRTTGIIAKSIALCISHRFGSGNSYFKTGVDQLQFVDAVAFGCYPKEVFTRIGLYNEHLVRSSDMELNIRLRNAGGKILLAPDIIAYYYTDSSLLAFWKHNFKDGVWATYPLKFTRALFPVRHFIPLILVISVFGSFLISFISPGFWLFLLFILGIYAAAALISALHIVMRERNIQYIFFTPIVFVIRHFAYGIGSFWGFAKLVF